MKKMILAGILVPLVVLMLAPAVFSRCVVPAEDLSLQLPCVEFQGSYYRLGLSPYRNPADPGWPYWRLAALEAAPAGSECARVDDDLNITVPSVCYAGYNMAITLENCHDPLDPAGLYWKLAPSVALNQVRLQSAASGEERCFDLTPYNSPEMQPALARALTCIQYCWRDKTCLMSCAVKSASWTTVAAIIGRLWSGDGCEEDFSWPPAPEKIYTGTLTVLQKDAYRNTGGRSSSLWPPHTTTVFAWDFGREVQTNHGTAPGEVDANGKPFLVEAKVYTFTGTRSQMEALQAAYKQAVYDDDDHQFISLTNGKTVLEKSFLAGLQDYLDDDDNGLVCSGSVNREKLLELLAAGDFHGFAVAMESCSWDQDDWERAFAIVLDDVVSASLQVGLIKNYLATGKVEIPPKLNDGPMWYFAPE
ncbi:MAG: hypothetical protein JRJ56_07625 [Deltaproteobacteria bacterium]|nr:hypothetical protein [Deltaproteobacteria bacterium]